MVDVSVVMPCLNEEKTVGICVEKAIKVFKENNIDGEVIVVDNGSTDNSAEVAKKAGARVVSEERKGKGYAMQKGFSEVKGKYIIIVDSDNTSNLLEIPKFLSPLMNEGYDFVNGSRFKGQILPGAMPWLHQHVGNTFLTKIFNLFFHTNISDMTSGFFGFKIDILKKIELKTAGFDFESEIKAKIAKENLKIAEVPVNLSPREKWTKPKLNSFRDGWKHLRFMFLFAPNWLFLIPGVIFSVIGLFLIFSILFGSLKIFWIYNLIFIR
ncbi:Glycosyl transferase family 2 (fragment) [groundwater metagenome]|uniref:Glycosyl transferase family 2 n=1 Tax=groundwater metagenome TaxID=717931 RepID=A0A098EAD4_9ZZZZ